MTQKQSLLRLTAVTFDQFSVSGIRFLFSIFLARVYGELEFGLYVLVWSAAQFLASIHTPMIITPLLSKVRFSHLLNFDTSLSHINLIFCLFTFAFVFIVTTFFSDSTLYAFSIAASATIFYMFEFIRKQLMISFHYKKLFILNFSYMCIILLIGFLTVIYGFTFTELLLGVSSLQVLLVSIYLFYGKSVNEYQENELKKCCLELYKYSKESVLLGWFQFISGHIFIYLLAIKLGQGAAGEVGAARNIVGPIIILYMILDVYFIPKMTAVYHDKNKEIINYCIGLLWKSVVITSIIAFILFLFSEQICFLLYGNQYQYAPLLLKGLSISLIFMTVSRVLIIYIRLSPHNNYITKAAILCLITSLLLSFPLIDYFDYIGAIIVINAQQFIVALTFLIALYKSTKRTNAY